MLGRQGQKVADGVEPFLEDGERVLSAIVAAARGHTQAVAGARGLGQKQQAGAGAGAAAAGLELASPMGLVLTDRRLMTLRIGTPWGLGLGGAVKDLMSAIPLSSVESIEAKRLAVGKTLTITANGYSFKLEAGAGADAHGLAEAFEQAKTSAAPA